MNADGHADEDSRQWFDDEAGPVVRPYAMTRGRTAGSAGEWLSLTAMITTRPADGQGRTTDPEVLAALVPEHLTVLGLCREQAWSVAELASDLDLPVGVMRVLLSDLLDAGLIRVQPPVRLVEAVDETVLRDVIAGLRAL
ncbi:MULTISPECIES: DUF742 domain-containing protein [Streptomyces]|uniref:DUF742 domain-containing protein n=1 Tax=Streptomyces chilikensis TaxID=1194079 RepID=A0ABV3EZG9_9ACTN|nr:MULTISPECIES: DUF742 domain-containing protein [Streptomyces]MDH6228000.1 DNA-directed RNA polymerase specialized sigma24 family protein [Streptomyces sp. MJP52]